MTVRDLIFDIPWIFRKSRSILHNDFKVERGLIHSSIGKADLVLDFGCGSGQYSELIEDEKYTGVDIDGPHLGHARAWYPRKRFLAFNENFGIPCGDGSFDWVICIAVVHHIPPNGVTRFRDEILRVLRQSGRILVWDPVPVPHQEGLLSKFLFSIDRGRFPRLPEAVIGLFGDAIAVKENTRVKAGPYSGYLLILEKK